MEKFDLDLVKKRRARAAQRIARGDPESAGFLHLLAADQIAERLEVTNREFERPALLFDGPFSSLVTRRLANLENIRAPFTPAPLPQQGSGFALPLEPESHDLVISVFDLHWIGDIPGMLAQINRVLVPDGLLMAVMPGAGTLGELAGALLAAEAGISGGAAPRIDPFAEVRQFGDLLQRTGFRLPVADQETFTLRYRELQGIVRDLRDIGAGSVLAAENPHLSHAVWENAKARLEAGRDGGGKIPVTVGMVHLSGWKVHESQQKPLKPGSAERSLANALRLRSDE